MIATATVLEVVEARCGDQSSVLNASRSETVQWLCRYVFSCTKGEGGELRGQDPTWIC